MASSGRKSNDELLAAELAAGKTVKDAAAAAQVSERTATRRLTDPDFREKVSAIRGEMIGRAAGRLADGMGEAAGVLRALLTDADANIRFRAAGKLIELGVKVVELSDLEQRVVELEAYLAETAKGGRGP
jgi:hypothetical protein